MFVVNLCKRLVYVCSRSTYGLCFNPLKQLQHFTGRKGRDGFRGYLCFSLLVYLFVNNPVGIGIQNLNYIAKKILCLLMVNSPKQQKKLAHRVELNGCFTCLLLFNRRQEADTNCSNEDESRCWKLLDISVRK